MSVKRTARFLWRRFMLAFRPYARRPGWDRRGMGRP